MPSSKPIVVIGGGISGLACAWRLRTLNLPVLLLESSPRFGGVIGTVEKNGFRFDIGPQSFMAGGSLLCLIEELGLAGQLCAAPALAPRYILLRGRLIPAPLGPIGLTTTPLISWKTKLRLAGDPFGHTHPPADDESIAAFVRRKFGEDLLANLVAPFVSGVYAGDTEKLSLGSTFPRLREFEEQSGSIVRGAIASRRARARAAHQAAAGAKAPDDTGSGSAAVGATPTARAPRPKLSNFPGGLVTFIDALTARLGDAACAAMEVLEIRPRGAGGGNRGESTAAANGFEVICRDRGGVSHAIDAAAVIVATPTSPAAQLLAGLDPRFAETLARIEYAPVAQVSAGYRLRDLSPLGAARSDDELSGFGFLVPRSEGLRLLGTVWNSSLFPNRVPDGAEKMAAFTSFLGGATDPEICRLSDGEITQVARNELGKVMHATGAPPAEYVTVWQRAIPQYNLGHPRIVATLKQLCTEHSGIFLAGNYLSGPSIPACIEQAGRVVEDAAHWLAAQP